MEKPLTIADEGSTAIKATANVENDRQVPSDDSPSFRKWIPSSWQEAPSPTTTPYEVDPQAWHLTSPLKALSINENSSQDETSPSSRDWPDGENYVRMKEILHSNLRGKKEKKKMKVMKTSSIGNYLRNRWSGGEESKSRDEEQD